MAVGQHLVFYDGTCGMCHWVVQLLLRYDHKKLFVFAPLQGETAELLLKDWRTLTPEADSLVLIENFQDQKTRKIYIYGKGALRICWLLGGLWIVPGSISFLPAFLYDWIYRWVARHRFKWFATQSCLIPKNQEASRFLP